MCCVALQTNRQIIAINVNNVSENISLYVSDWMIYAHNYCCDHLAGGQISNDDVDDAIESGKLFDYTKAVGGVL